MLTMLFENYLGTCPAIIWLRLCLPVWRAWVLCLVRKLRFPHAVQCGQKKRERKYCRNEVMSPKIRSEELLLLSTQHQQGTSHLPPRQLGLRTLLARLPVSGSQSMPGQDAPGFSLTGQCLGELGPWKAGL